MMDQNFLSLLLSQIAQVTILAVLVWWATRCFTKNRPHLAHALWLLVLLKCVTPPICHNPVSPFCWHWSEEGTDKQVVELADPLQFETVEVEYDSQSMLGPIAVPFAQASKKNAISSASIVCGHASEPLGQLKVVAPEATVQFHRGTWLIGLWFVGVALIAAIAVVRSVLFLRWLRTFPRRKHEALSEQLDSLTRKLGVRRSVRLDIVDGPVGPAVFGFWRPKVVLPQAIVENQTAGQLEPLLAHELIHLRRGDLWWSAVQTLATCAFWFHPLVWLASKKVSRESERSCDEETVASLGCCPTEYARCLLDVLEKKQLLRAAPAVPGIRQVDITSARLERVMTFRNGIRKTTPLWIRLAFVALAILVLPGAAAAVQQETEEAIEVAVPDSEPLLPAVSRVIADEHDVADSDAIHEIREYDISEMLAHLESADLEVSKSELLKSWIGYAQPIYQASVKEVNTFNVRNDKGELESHQLPVCETNQVGSEVPELEFDLQNQKVSVCTTKKLHERVAKDIEHFSQFGFHQVVFETRILSTDRETWETLEIPWETALSSHGKGEFEKQWVDHSPVLGLHPSTEFAGQANENAHVRSK